MSLTRKLGLGLVFAWFFGGGVAHFVVPQFFAAIVPPWAGDPLRAVYVSAVFEILGALGILIAATRRWAGLGLFLLTLCVTPANVYMLQNAERFPEVPVLLLWLRLPVQLGLLALIWWSTTSQPAGRA